MSWKLSGLLGIGLGLALGSIGCHLAPACNSLPHRTLRIENPDRLRVRLYCRRGGADLAVEHLGRGTPVELQLPCGKYWLDAGGTRFPVPLLEQLPTAGLSVTVSVPPPPPSSMVAIPAGWSLQGDELGIGQPDEGPARTVYLPAFAMGRAEVTNAEFQQFLNATESPGNPGDSLDRWIALDSATCRIQFDRASKKFSSDAPELPVVNVSWDGARAYCAWLARKTGRPYRLPTEAEWEKAARGPHSSVFAYGDRYLPAAANQESGCLLPASSFAANAWGLRDMTGNAYEWCADHYADASPYRVLRGGSFVLDGVYLRNSFRMRYRPTVMSDDIGFRLAMDLRPQDNKGASR